MNTEKAIAAAKRVLNLCNWSSPSSMRVLLFLSGGGSSIGAIAAGIGTSGANVTGLVDRLEGEGLVERLADNDRRVVFVKLKEPGEAFCQRVADEVRASLKEDTDQAELP